MKKHNSRGGVALTALLVCSFAAILLAGWSYTLTSGDNHQPYIPGTDSMGYHPLSVSPNLHKTWWVTEKDADGADKRLFELERRGKKSFKFDLPNVGVKDPEDIVWPYKDGFTYELVQGEHAFSVYPQKGTFASKYVTGEGGGILSEVFDYWPAGNKYSMLRFNSILAFDENRKMVKTDFMITENPSDIKPDAKEQKLYEISLETKDDKLHMVSTNLMPKKDESSERTIVDITVDAPEDGFYTYTGSNSPGQIALLLSTLELDGEEPACVWILGGGNMALWNTVYGNQMKVVPLFTRMTVYPLEDCPSWLRKWWLASRRFYDGWKPGELRTYILFEEGANYFSHFDGDKEPYTTLLYNDLYRNGGDIVVVYLDDKDRLVRVEQVGASYCTAAQLKKIGTDDKWWGK